MDFAKRLVVLLACVVLALATFPADAQSKKESKAATKFRTDGEQARKSVEAVRGQLERTLKAYEELLSASDKKLQSAHKKLTGEISKTEKAVESGKKQVQIFQEGAETFFTMWEGNLESISTASIRDASGKRLEMARTSFQNMSDNLSAAGESYGPLIASLKEQATLLQQDLSADTVEMMNSGPADDVRAKGEEIFAALDRILNDEKAHEESIDAILDEEVESDSEAIEDSDADSEGSEEDAG